MEEKIILRCSVAKCPRKLKIKRDMSMPEGTVVVKSKCPWHQDGDFDNEQFYDKEENELVWEPKNNR